MRGLQQEVCEAYGAEFLTVHPDDKLGLSEGVRQGRYPLHGLRHLPERGTCGWYIWSEEYSEASDFFTPIHLSHLAEDHPVMRYLGLAPGWRFLITPDFEDVWFDPALLNTQG